VAILELACAGPLFLHPKSIVQPPSIAHTEEAQSLHKEPSADEAKRIEAKLDDNRSSSQSDKHVSFCDEVARKCAITSCLSRE
jgi:hypothetical protein